MDNLFDDHSQRKKDSELVSKLVAIFPCSFVIDNFYIIKDISVFITQMLGFKSADLLGKHISVLSHDLGFEHAIREKLKSGFFHNYHTFIKNSDARNVFVNLSGFDSEMLRNDGDLIVIQVENIEERQITEASLLEKTRQLESLLHCAWHDLRGPIATIKGVITLANMRKDDQEINLYFEWLSSNANRLDHELKKLLDRVHSLNSDNEQTK